MSNKNWNNDTLQFPRLLAEISATQELDMQALADSMDLSLDEVNELFDRAGEVWEGIKEGLVPSVTLDLNICDDEGNVVDGTTAELTVPQISDVVDHAAQLILVNRAGGDVDAVVAELEEALVAAAVLDAA